MLLVWILFGFVLCVHGMLWSIRCSVTFSVVHTLSNFNLYEDAVQESLDDFDDLSDAISDPTTL